MMHVLYDTRAQYSVFGRRYFLCATFLLLLCSLPTFALTPQTWQTTRHTTVLFYATHHAPMVTIHMGFKAGSAYDGEQWGLAALTTSMLNQGNAGLNATEIANQFADTGGLFSSSVTRDMLIISLTTLTDPAAFSQAISTFQRVLINPDFPPSILEQEKNQQLAAIVNEQATPQSVATLAFFKTLYANHPYGHSIFGTAAHVNALQITNVRAFYQKYLTAENAVMVMVGDLSVAAAKQLSEQLTLKLPQGQAAAPLPLAPPLMQGTEKFLSFPASQTTLNIGEVAITHHDPAYFPLIVGNYILGGGGMLSRLTEALREKRGLTYHVDSEFVPMPAKGPFIIHLATQTKHAKQAQQLVQEILQQFIQNGPTNAEIIAAKQYLVGSFPLTLSSNTEIANVLLKMAFYQLPLDFLETYTQHIQAVSATDIKRAFQQTLSTHPRLTVIVGHAP